MTEDGRQLKDSTWVARKLGLVTAGGKVNIDLFYRKRKELRDRGFPEPVLGRGRGQRWDPAAIDAWLNNEMPDALRAPAAAPASGDMDDAAWAAELERRLSAPA